MKQYPHYKDSGVEWLGEVPEHWDFWKISHAFGSIGSGTTPPSDEPSWYDDGTVHWVTTGELREAIITDTAKHITTGALERFSALRLHPAGSLVMAMYGATIGRLGILGVSATTNQACCVLSRPKQLAISFVYFWLLGFKQQLIDLYATGGGQPNINQDIISGWRIPAPAISEQSAIATFLDRETARIDRLIATQRRLITLLKEKRSALITHAVTKGLNPDAPMKDSGVEWLGEVPEHWGVVPIKRDATLRNDRRNDVPDGWGYIGLEDVESDSGRYVPTNGEARQSEESLVGVFCAGDVLYGKLRPYLRKSIIADRDGVCSTEFLVLTPGRAAASWLHRWLLTPDVTQQIEAGCDGAKMPRAHWEHVGSVPLTLPPLTEQSAIAAFLDRETARIDRLIAATEQSIALAQERRSALITAAVTGKIDVRNIAPNPKEQKTLEVL